MKQIFKILAGLLIGVISGLIIAATGIVIFTDTTLAEFASNLSSAAFSEVTIAALASIAGFLVSIFIIITFHEAGHLVCGLMSGYKFVSFRIFNLTFIRVDNHLQVKKYSISGTGGQCLLTPPDLPLDKIPTSLYNAGGILANIILLLIAAPFIWLVTSPLWTMILVIFCFTDVFIILINAIPMRVSGIGNDGYNMLHLRDNPLSKMSLITQLKSNALIQAGVRPKEMPAGWFEWRDDIDWKNGLEVSIPMMHASWLVDKFQWNEAYDEFERIYQHKSDIMQLYVNEIACELAFCAMITGRIERAKELLDSKLMKYIETYKNVMSSKQRILYAKALYIDNEPQKANGIYETLCKNRSKYLLQGEVKSDLAIMESMQHDINHYP